MKLEFSRVDFSKNTKKSYYVKIHPVGAELLPADRQTDIQVEANSFSLQFLRKRLETAITSIQHQLIGFNNRDGVCLLRGTD